MGKTLLSEAALESWHRETHVQQHGEQGEVESTAGFPFSFPVVVNPPAACSPARAGRGRRCSLQYHHSCLFAPLTSQPRAAVGLTKSPARLDNHREAPRGDSGLPGTSRDTQIPIPPTPTRPRDLGEAGAGAFSSELCLLCALFSLLPFPPAQTHTQTPRLVRSSCRSA